MNDLRYSTLKRLLLFSALFSSLPCAAQEVSFLDLTTIESSVELRRPPAPKESDPGRIGSYATVDCRHPPAHPPKLRTTLVSLDRTHYQAGDEPRFEVKIENVGSASVQIPFYPHLADLQPEDAAAKFKYRVLEVTLWIAEAEKWSSNSGGTVTLYSSAGRADTSVTIHPGEWVRLVGKGHILSPADGPPVVKEGHADRMYAATQIYEEQFLMTSTQSAGVKNEVCLSDESGGSLPILMEVSAP